MAIIRTALLVSSTLAAPTLVMQQPLKTGPGSADPGYAAERLSPLAVAGHALYRAYCANCHGPEAEGTGAGPSLVDGGIAAGKFERMTFHNVVRQGRPNPERGYGPMPAFDLTFNQIELIGRYVREMAGVDGG